MGRGNRVDSDGQRRLPFGPIYNRELFSNHWLENRLPLEPEWEESKVQAKAVLQKLLELWSVQRKRVEKYDAEGPLEQAFIQPVFEMLGWKINYQTHLRGRKPDYALFLSEESLYAALKAGRKSPDFWKFPALLSDAKAWYRSLDRPEVVDSKREYPPEQIGSYLLNSHLNYAILTSGKLWRLIPREHTLDQPRFQTYLECDLQELLEKCYQEKGFIEMKPIFEEFLKFYLFFSPIAYFKKDERLLLIDRARNGSSEYRLGIEDDLKHRVFEALRFCIEGFLQYSPNNLDADKDIYLCREQTFIVLYRLLFVMYAEDRGLLPYRVNKLYTDNRSIGRYRDEIGSVLDRLARGDKPKIYSKEATDIWDDLKSLFDLIDTGHKRYGVPAYDGGLFDLDLNLFLSENKISDWYLARVIDFLSRAPDKTNPDLGFYRVDYRDLQIQHLGSIYEGLLELNPHIASQKMIVIKPTLSSKSKIEMIISTADKLPRGYVATEKDYKKGEVYLTTDKGERRASGSYYTPNNIVDYIVENTIGPLCKEINDALDIEIETIKEVLIKTAGNTKKELEEKKEFLQGQYDDRVLSLKILDPAMGSGHFLLRTCQYLAEDIATHPYTADPEYDDSSGMESALTFWKRRIVERCLYGVDKNPMAVELAKLALWLETVSIDQPLTFLDHHLRCGNSIVGARISDLSRFHGTGDLFDFSEQLDRRLPDITEPIRNILLIPSHTASQVREKKQHYKRYSEAKYPFCCISDLWCSYYYLEKDSKIDVAVYQSAMNLLGKPKKFVKYIDEKRFQRALAQAKIEVACFHWELEFPEVFLETSGKYLGAGFNAIIGNPPYDVLSEKEIGYDLSKFKNYIENQKVYNPSRVGKNNLYKLFICKALELLVDTGRFSFIVPMPLLGDEQSLGIRKELITNGTFTSIEAFPQKDDPKKRVFQDAKLSTAIFIYKKTNNEVEKQTSFSSRVHRANIIEESSPELRLSMDNIHLYDNSNLSIVSCAQEDWNLAVNIMKSGRFTRLSNYCESFQGEVNETNEAEKGNITKDSNNGPQILRGSNICLYALREASQGEPLFVNVDRFLKGKREGAKAFHSQQLRVGFQRSSPQNNFRRLISCFIMPSNFCFDTVSYIPESHSKLSLYYVIGLLNSKLLDWYFRLGEVDPIHWTV